MKHSLLFLSLCTSLAIGHPSAKPHTKSNYEVPTKANILGTGNHRYQLVPGWAQQNTKTTPVGHCHAMVEDSKGRLFLANTAKNSGIVILSPDGKVLSKWNAGLVGAHGLKILTEAKQEVLFIADADGHQVLKTTLEGKILLKLNEPTKSGLYKSRDEFKPSKTLHLPNGDFYIIDGYGKDYVHRYNAKGEYLSSFGGDLGEGEAKLAHYGPHGGEIDFSDPKKPTILLALSDQQKLKRFTLDGKHLATIPMLKGNPRDIIFHGDAVYIPHLGDNWPADLTSPGVITIHDRKTLKLITTLGGTPPQEKKPPFYHQDHTFCHPHGLLITRSGHLYVAQFRSASTYPLKFNKLSTPIK